MKKKTICDGTGIFFCSYCKFNLSEVSDAGSKKIKDDFKLFGEEFILSKHGFKSTTVLEASPKILLTEKGLICPACGKKCKPA